MGSIAAGRSLDSSKQIIVADNENISQNFPQPIIYVLKDFEFTS